VEASVVWRRGPLPAFIIEEFEDGRYTVFIAVNSNPVAGAVYVLDPSQCIPWTSRH
jgi:hypothetical protein